MSRVVSGRSGLSDLTEAELPVLLPNKEIETIIICIRLVERKQDFRVSDQV